MSWSPCPDPVPGDRASTDAIETLIVPRAVDLGEMEVRRQTIEPGAVNWSTPPNSRGPWAYRRSGFHSFPRDPRVQQIEQQAFRHDAPEIVSRGHHLGEGVAENQLLLSEENHFAMFSHFGS